VSARLALSRLGVNRSTLVRVLTRLGQPRLRRLRGEAMTASGPRGALLRAAVKGIEAGTVTVPVGHAQGLAFELRHLRIDHAHLGSIACGMLETSVQEALVRHLGPGDVLLDVGANLGFFSLLGSRLVGSRGHVYALEPVPENALAIRRHAELNHAGNVSVMELAAARCPGTGRLQLVDDRSWSKLEGYGDHPGTERVMEVELVSIDQLIEAGTLPAPSLVKIDVEGAELDVLHGMKATLERARPAVICEVHGTHRPFAEYMRQCGYWVINLEGPRPIEQDPCSEHALALPPGERGD
jgi:FkbM family methyltransferase